jgi:predicted membrane-bound spermidine synthase
MGTPPAPAPLPLARLAGVGAVVFLANAALLVLQLVAGRLLAPFVGSSLETWTAVIGVFLTGIALGNAWGGKLADRYPTPRTLAALLALGALAAAWMLAVPGLLTATGWHKPVPLGLRIPLLSVVLCLPAGLVLSLLTPLAIKLGLPDVSRTGRVAGLVFALSTLGCLLGNYVTGFYLIPAFTINTLVLVAAGTLLVLAAGTMVVLRVDPPAGEPVGEAAAPTGPPLNGSTAAFPDVRQAYLIVFLASFGGMTLELTAARVIAQFLGVSLYTWTGVIGVMLAGTALGNFAGGVVADRVNRPGSAVSPRHALAGTLLAAGAATVFIFVSMAVLTQRGGFRDVGLVGQVLGWTFALFFLPMFVLGMVSPQVIRLAVPDVAHAGRVAGRVYAWSTAGAIAGTFAAGYVLLSAVGMNRTMLGVALVVTLTSLLAARVWLSNPMLYLFSIVLGGVTGGFILTAKGPGRGDPDTVAVLETNYYTIKVTRAWDGGLKLTLDHLVHSTADPANPLYLYYEHEQVQMEFLWAAREHNPNPKVLVIGGGGYTFPRAAMELLPETRMDVVEIDPGVTRVAYQYLGLKPYPGLRSVNMDGRQFVAERADPGSYDLVIQDAVNDLSVPAHLLTREYNDAVKTTLKPGGVYLLTVIDSVEHGRLWRSAMRTLRETFPAANVALLTANPLPGPADESEWGRWATTRQVYVIYASDRPLDLPAVRAAVTRQTFGGFAAGLSAPAVAVAGPAFYTHQVPPERLDRYTAADPGVILTDQYAPVDNLMADVFRRRKEQDEIE